MPPSIFRFEYLWPFWLLVRSIYDSFKYQGLVSLIGLEYLMKKKYSQIPGVLSILHMHRPDQRHDLLPLYPGPLALLCGEHLRLGAVCVAHG